MLSRCLAKEMLNINGALKDILVGWTSELPYSASSGGQEGQNDKASDKILESLAAWQKKWNVALKERHSGTDKNDKDRNSSSLRQWNAMIYEQTQMKRCMIRAPLNYTRSRTVLYSIKTGSFISGSIYSISRHFFTRSSSDNYGSFALALAPTTSDTSPD